MKITHKIHYSPESGFVNSRTALKNLLKDEGLEVLDLKKDLELQNFREMPKFPHFFTSLSHTKGLGAAVLVPQAEARGLGIDIEWEDREIKPGALKFFVNQADQHSLTHIELWTAKEAAFKALSPLGSYPGTLVLSKIIVEGPQFYTAEEPKLVGNLVTYKQQIENRNFVFTIATISL